MDLIVATRNEGKLREFRRMLEPLGFHVLGQESVCPGIEVEEDGTTFQENARKKALAIYRITGKATVADDSGLCVDALDGAPGVYSARYAADLGKDHNDKANNQKLLENLKNVPLERRGAQFVAAICCVLGEGDLVEVQGVCPGFIGFQEAGYDGFGYDPLFLVGEKSFGELSAEEKDAVSHRGKALRALCQELAQRK